MTKLNKLLKLSILITSLFLTACMSTKTFTNTVKSKLGIKALVDDKLNEDFVILKTEKLQFLDSAVIVRKQKSYFIPAIVYWEKRNTIGCTINDRYFVNLFSVVFKEAAEEFQLKKHLGSRRLEISLESEPSNFVYTDKFYGVFLFICFSLYSEYIRPTEPNIKVTYRIFDGDLILKTGKYSAVVIDRTRNNFDSRSEFIEGYLDNLKSNFEQHSEKAILQILDELY